MTVNVKKEGEEDDGCVVDPFLGAISYVDEDAEQDVQDAMLKEGPPDAVGDTKRWHDVLQTSRDPNVPQNQDATSRSVAGTEPKCYLIGTSFRSEMGGPVLVEELKCNDKLMAANGSIVEVRDIKRITSSDDRTMMWLESVAFQVPLTANHKVMVLRGSQHQSMPAGHLRPGDSVLCTNGERVLTRAESFLCEDDVFEITVEPCSPLETVYIALDPHEALLTKAKRIRRSRMPPRLLAERPCTTASNEI